MPKEYNSILKATTIFGGAQILQILVGLLKSKFIAILIGTAGMGLSSLYMSSLTMIITIFGLGLNSSVVRELSKAYDNNDLENFSIIAIIFKRLLYVLSFVGTTFVILFSAYLSKWAFNTTNKSLDYCFLSLIVCFTLLAQGNTAILVSSRRIKATAICTLIGSIVNLLSSIPLFYFFGVNGIVPGLIVSTIANYIVTYFFAHQVKIHQCSISKDTFKRYSKTLIELGIAMILTSLLGNITLYLINVSITRMGGLSDLGLFNAGMSITVQVVTLIFAAMGADYYPRLVATMSDTTKMNNMINQQNEIILYLCVPILAILMLVAPWVVSMLLSPDFYAINSFIRILCLGMLFKATSYVLGYISFAKGDKMIYLFLEGGYANITNLLFSISMYYLWGLVGLAYSFVLNYILYWALISLVAHKRYAYYRSKTVNDFIILAVFTLTLMLLLTYILEGLYFYIIGTILCIVCSGYCLCCLNKKTDILSTLKLRLWKK